MSSLDTAIENLYSAFNQYSTAGIHYCNCGCIKESDVAKLHSKPLSRLTDDDLVFYHGKATTTWGDLEHYKHFLPRIFELLVAKEGGPSLIYLREIADKLENAAWTAWPEGEPQAIRDFVLEAWTEIINNRPDEYGDIDLENYSRFVNIEQLVQRWNITGSENALRNFIVFFYYYGNAILNFKFILSKKDSDRLLRDLIYVPGLTEKLQEEFFRQESIDREYSEKISIVLQMIEAQMKVDGKTK